MRRIWLAVGIIAFVISLSIAPALAQEATKPDGSEKKAAEATGKAADEASAEKLEAEEELEAVTGEKIEVVLREGDVIDGVMKGTKAEVMVNGRYRKAKSKDDPGAGIRVFYAMGLNGFVFVPYATIEEVKFNGALSEDEGISIARRIAAERRRSEQDRVRVAEELAAKKRAAKEKAAAEAAGESGEEGEKAAAAEEKPEAADGGEGHLSDADRSKKIRDLLKTYPPEEWKPSRLAEIKDRKLILSIYPTEEERGFMKDYDLWLEGYEIWRKQKETLGK